MTGGKILAGSGEAWLRDAVSHPAARIAASVSEQMALLGDTADSVVINSTLASETLQRDEHRGRGYLPVCGLRVYTSAGIGGVVVVTQDALFALMGDQHLRGGE